MVVYEFGTAKNTWQLDARHAGDLARTEALAGLPVPDGWAPPEVEVIRDGSGGRRPADVLLYGTVPAFTARAVDAVGDLLAANGQLLPLRSRDGEFYAYNVTTVVNALDEERSAVVRFSTGRVMLVEQYEFVPERLDAAFFALPQFPRGRRFYTGAFLARVRAAGLAGLDPRQVWPRPRPRSSFGAGAA